MATVMFDRGAAGLDAAVPRLPHVRFDPPVSLGDTYVCPLCLVGVHRDRVGHLTKEHAPPRSIGGKVIALTCDPCNTGAGAMQRHAAQRQRWEHFAARSDGASHDVEITGPDGAAVAAVVEHRGDAFVILVDDSRSDPAHLDALINRLDAGETDFTMTGDVGFIESQAQVSDLRDAYLAAFALLGYRFILWPDLDTIRNQISTGSPNSSLFKATDLLPDDFLGLLTLSSPVQTVCAVRPGGRCVFLPWPNQGPELADWLAAGAPIADLAGRAHEWPTGMPMLLDFPQSDPGTA